MPCKKCMTFIHDVLLHPPHPSSHYVSSFKRKRLLRCIEKVTYLLTKQIEDDRPDMIDWLNMMEIMNCRVLNQAATRDYRMYQVWVLCENTIDEIIIILIEHGILAKIKDRYHYEEWFAEKAIFFLKNLPEIHTEHSMAYLKNIPEETINSSPA